MDPQGVEVTLVGMSGVAQQGLARILAAEKFQVRCLHHGEIEGAALTGHIQMPDRLRIFIIDREVEQFGTGVGLFCAKIRFTYPMARVVLLAERYKYDDVAVAFNGGVDGYILKSVACQALFIQLKLIAMGAKILPSQLAGNLPQCKPTSMSRDWTASIEAVALSSRQIDILACISRGMANKVISRHYKITEATVKVHVKAILRKLQVSSRTQAAIWAVQHGFDSSHAGDDSDFPAASGDDA